MDKIFLYWRLNRNSIFMEKGLEPIQKLDEVLNYLRTQKSFLTDAQLSDNLQTKGLIISEDDLIRITDRLINDGYIIERKRDKKQTAIDPKYLISYKGYLFQGYVEQKRIDNINQNIAETKEKIAIRNDIYLVRGTWFAGIAAILLTAWQIFLYFYPPHADAVHVILQK
jgi:hypothetical protein